MLPKCEACHGLVPHDADACPNCLAAPRASTAKRAAVSVLAVVAGAGVSLTLMACYGAPSMMVEPANPVTSASAPDPTDTATPATSGATDGAAPAASTPP